MYTGVLCVGDLRVWLNQHDASVSRGNSSGRCMHAVALVNSKQATKAAAAAGRNKLSKPTNQRTWHCRWLQYSVVPS